MIISIYLDDTTTIHPKDEARLAEIEHCDNIIYSKKSTYNDISVLDCPIGRILLFEDTYQGGFIKYKNFTGGFPYTRYYHLSKLINDDINNILVLGLGSGSVVKDCLNIYDIQQLDIVEIDKNVISIAKEYFNLKDIKQVNIICEEARQYVSNCKTIYDLIIVDVFEARGMPYSLMTKEFIDQLNKILSNNGLVGVNYFGYEDLSGPSNEIFLAQYKTYRDIFPSVYAIPVLYGGYEFFREALNLRYKMGSLTNIMLLASKDPLNVSKPELIQRARDYLKHSKLIMPNIVDYARDLFNEKLDIESVNILSDNMNFDKPYNHKQFIQRIQNQPGDQLI